MLNFYLLFTILVYLGSVKFLLKRSPLSTFLTVSLVCCLCYCVFQTFFTLLLVDQECVLLSLNQLGFKAIDCNLSNNDPSVCFSPAEEQVIGKDPHQQLANFAISLGVMLAICQACVGVLRKLRYTQEFAKTMTDKGWPRWLFFWISHSNPEPFPERSLFHLLVCILVLNLVILYGLFSTL
jgi:hypothetical protein